MQDLVNNNELIITLDKGEHLPIADLFGTIDPYITINIVKGDPLDSKYNGPTKGRGDKSPLGSARSTTITQNQFPIWNDEKVRLPLPDNLAEELDNLYIHIKLWDWDFMKSDDLIGEFAYPLKRVITEPAMPISRPFSIAPMRKAEEQYDLKKTRIYVKFALGRKDKKKEVYRGGGFTGKTGQGYKVEDYPMHGHAGST